MIWVGVGSMSAFAILLAWPFTIRSQRKPKQSAAINNLHQIGFSLLEFESKYGRLPDKITAVELKRKSGTTLTLSDRTSNDVFVQLIAAGLAIERNFDTHFKSTRTPDGVCSTDTTALAHRETGFAYISGLSSSGNPSRPIVFGPVIPGTTRLDPTAFDGKAVVLKLDSSVSSLPISPSGQIILGGEDMLDPKNLILGGKAFTVKWPK